MVKVEQGFLPTAGHDSKRGTGGTVPRVIPLQYSPTGAVRSTVVYSTYHSLDLYIVTCPNPLPRLPVICCCVAVHTLLHTPSYYYLIIADKEGGRDTSMFGNFTVTRWSAQTYLLPPTHDSARPCQGSLVNYTSL